MLVIQQFYKNYMIIGLDIGNTHIVTGIYESTGKLLLTFRIATNDKMTEDEFFIKKLKVDDN